MDLYNDELSPEENTGRALFAIARALQDLGYGSGDGTHPGCVEFLGMEIRDKGQVIVDQLTGLVDAATTLADAVERGNE